MKFRNLMSYGNSMTEFKFDTGLSLISAKNGSGKTTLLEALSFNWYGKPYRDIKLAELVNRKNKKNLYTETEFENEGITYNIIRTLSPAKLIIKKNGEVMENLSAKKLDQEEINKILGIDHNIFKMIIALSVNYNKPFLSMSTSAKRDTVESIFNIKVFGEMLSRLKKRNSIVKNDNILSDGVLRTLENSITALRKQITDIENSIGDVDKENYIEICSFNDKISEANTNIDALELKAKSIKKEIGLIHINDVSDQLMESKINIGTLSNKMSELNEQLSFFDAHDSCPLCSVAMTTEHKENELEKINKSISSFKEKLESVKLEREVLLDVQIRNTESKEKIDSLKNSLYETIQDAKSEANNISFYKDQIASLSKRKLSIDTTSITEEYNSQVEEYKKVSKVSSELKETLIVNEYIFKVLSEDGIKSYFFRKLVPILNKKINEHLTSFELPVIISFDEYMVERIDIPLSNDKDVSYMSFSEGEKKRIDVAILLSFIETTKILSNWNCNVIMFDEVLDNATDSEGLDKLLSSIKDLTIKDPKLCSYIISHREGDSEVYDRKITIKKVAGFSKI